MTYTKSETDFIQELRTAAGGRISSSTLQFLMKRHFKKTYSKAELDDYLSTTTPRPPLTPPPIPMAQSSLSPGLIKKKALELIRQISEATDVGALRPSVFEETESGITPILCLSDLHFGEKIERNGREIFNLEIAEARFMDIIDQAINAREYEGHTIDNFVVLLAGDIIDGELIFPAQAYESDGALFLQLQKATKIVWQGLAEIAAHYPVQVYCVPGNHGRTSKLHNQMSNWDNALYFALRMMSSFSDLDIEIVLPHQLWMDFPVRQWTVHTRHIGVNQAVTAGPFKKVSSWMDNHSADLFFYGHYHDPCMFSHGYRRIFKNGALPPLNEFAERNGFEESIGQWLVAVSDQSPVEFSKVIIPFV